MLKNISQLELTVDGKTGRFMCESDTSTTIAKEMLFQFQKFVGQIEDNAKAAEAQAASEQVAEALKPE